MDFVLFTLMCDEVSETGISSILCELLKDSSLFQEWGVRPFTWPYFRQPLGVQISVRRLPNNSLGVLLGTKLPKDIHVFPINKNLEIFSPQNFLNRTSQK